MGLPGKWIDRVGQYRAFDKLILDLNSSVSKTYGRRKRLAAQRGAQRVRYSGLFDALPRAVSVD